MQSNINFPFTVNKQAPGFNRTGICQNVTDLGQFHWREFKTHNDFVFEFCMYIFYYYYSFYYNKQFLLYINTNVYSMENHQKKNNVKHQPVHISIAIIYKYSNVDNQHEK